MRAFLTMTAMLRTMVLILVPTVLMHGVLTLGNNLITILERSLTEVTSLSHHLSTKAHLIATIDLNVLALEELVSDVRFQELEHQPNK
jgi:hypothetical protein